MKAMDFMNYKERPTWAQCNWGSLVSGIVFPLDFVYNPLIQRGQRTLAFSGVRNYLPPIKSHRPLRDCQQSYLLSGWPEYDHAFWQPCLAYHPDGWLWWHQNRGWSDSSLRTCDPRLRSVRAYCPQLKMKPLNNLGLVLPGTLKHFFHQRKYAFFYARSDVEALKTWHVMMLEPKLPLQSYIKGK